MGSTLSLTMRRHNKTTQQDFWRTPMITLSDRSSTFTDSVIRRMSRVCAKYGALNLAQGFPDYNPPEPILERLSKVAFEGPHQYATTWGAQNFREALCEKVKHFSGLEYDPNSEVCVTCGGTEAMMASVLATINPGDKVAIFRLLRKLRGGCHPFGGSADFCAAQAAVL